MSNTKDYIQYDSINIKFWKTQTIVTESKSMVAWNWSWKEGIDWNGPQGTFNCWKCSIILTVVVDTWLQIMAKLIKLNN